MAENNFPIYENFYYNISNSNHQMNDLNISVTSTLDSDILPSLISYTNNEVENEENNNNNVNSNITNTNNNNNLVITDEEMVDICSTSANGYSPSQPRGMYTMLLGSMVSSGQQLLGRMDTTNTVDVSSTSFNERLQATTGVYSNTPISSTLPFVQIHTSDVEPTITNGFCPVYRQTHHHSKQDDIKYEPIKSENNDVVTKEATIQSRPQLASIPLAVPSILDVEAPANIVLSVEHNTTIENSNQEYQETEIFKCDHCPFISLTELERQKHLAKVHINTLADHDNEENHQSDDLNLQQNHIQQRFNCPGCSNVFYTLKSLEMHLKLDHLMLNEHLVKIMSTFNATNKKSATTVRDQNNVNGGRKRSRIYLKNVECLKEPSRTVRDEHDDNNTNHNNATIRKENYVDQSTGINSAYPKKQKISIKSVNVLREPALLHRDFQIQSNNLIDCSQYNVQDLSTITNNSNDCTDTEIIQDFEYDHLPAMQTDTTTSKRNVQCIMINNNNSINNINNIANSSTTTNVTNNNDAVCSVSLSDKDFNGSKRLEEPATSNHRPKIYVKSVESFNLMPTLELTVPILNNTSYNGIESLPTTSNNNDNNTTALNDTSLGYLSYLIENGNETNATNSNNIIITNTNCPNASTNEEVNVYCNNYHKNIELVPYFNGNNNSYLMDFNLNNSASSTSTTITTTVADSLSDNSKTRIVNELILLPHQSALVMNDMQTLPAENSRKLPNQMPSQEPKGTLHLRTVDELNLMNKNEVQNLIAPNLESNGGVLPLNISAENNELDLNKVNILSDNSLCTDENLKFQDLDTQMMSEWTEALVNDIDYIIAECENFRSDNSIPGVEPASKDSIAPVVKAKTDLARTNDLVDDVSIIHYEEHPTRDDEDDYRVSIVNFDCLTQELSPMVSKDNANITAGTNEAKQTVVNNPMRNAVFTKNNADSLKENTSPTDEDVTGNDSNLRDSNIQLPGNVTQVSASNATTSIENSLQSATPVVIANKTQNEAPNIQKPSSKDDVERTTPTTLSPLKRIAESMSNNSKKRIYIANNLMVQKEKSKASAVLHAGTSIRGRPFGSRLTLGKTNSKANPPDSNSAINSELITTTEQSNPTSDTTNMYKCAIKNCTFRFKKNETLSYHYKCHDSEVNCREIICPECKSKGYHTWNTLHTHLWRSHSIDMELYSCDMCDFKTPIYSRLINTHAKIHSDERNFKCEECEKTFKNSRQLKNHRRWHRNQSQAPEENIKTQIPKTPIVMECDNDISNTSFHLCSHCGAAFSHQRSLRAHCCTHDDGKTLKCEICQKTISSKYSLKLHMRRIHNESTEKCYKCSSCDYGTNDHNAFRRHRMGHDNCKMYHCSYCGYKCIQSTVYQKHVRLKHPEYIDSLIYKCSKCTFFTVNRTLWLGHLTKHEHKTAINADSATITTLSLNEPNTNNVTDESITLKTPQSKIKVKNNLFDFAVTEKSAGSTHTTSPSPPSL